MQTLIITVKAKNYRIIQDFFLFLKQRQKKNLKKHQNKKTKVARFAILKSPHVNKKAQEQFEIRRVKKQIIFKFLYNYKSLVYFKKLKSKAFPDLHIQFQSLSKGNFLRHLDSSLFCLNNFENFFPFLLYSSNKKTSYLKKIPCFKFISSETLFLLQNLDLYGEMLFKKKGIT